MAVAWAGFVAFLILPRVGGNTCPEHFTLRATGLTCPNTCSWQQCCSPPTGKCVSVENGACTNTTSHFSDNAKNNNDATSSNYNANCCTAKASCPTGTAHCAPGMKARANFADLKCLNAVTTGTTVESCSAPCCILDDTKCLGRPANEVCNSGTYKDTTKSGNAATTSNFQAQCCTAQAACPTSGTGHCTAGRKPKSSVTNLKCASSATTAASCSANCCETDNTKCGGISGSTCNSGSYLDSTKAGNAATSSNFQANCCTAIATCTGWSAGTAGTSSFAQHLKPVGVFTTLALSLWMQ